MADLLYKEEVFAIIGAAMEVHSYLGRGFSESVQQEAFSIELTERGIPFLPQVQLNVQYKGHQLNKYYIADFVCYGKIIVEIKSASQLTSADEGQVINYLRATGMKLGLLINFGSVNKLEWRRIVF